MPRAFVPDEGDVVWMNFDPQAGHEQGGHRPAVVITPASFNGPTGLMLCCPTTTRIKGYPFEVPIAGAVPSVALASHLKSLDWRARGASPKGRVTAAELRTIRLKLAVLIG